MNREQHQQQAEQMLAKAYHFTYGDGGDAAVGQAFATMAVAHAILSRGLLPPGAPKIERRYAEEPHA